MAKQRNLPLFILMMNMFIAFIGVGLIIPVLPKFILEFGASGKDLGYLVAAMGLTQFLFSPLGGKYADQYGRKRMNIIGLAILALSQFIFSFGQELWMLYFSRLIGGVGLAFLIPANLAYVADATTDEGRSKGMGLLGAAMSLGFVISPGIGGLLAEFGLRVPFYVSTVIAFIATILSLLFLPETLTKEKMKEARKVVQKKESILRPFSRSLRAPYFWLLLLILTLTFGLAAFQTTLGLYVDNKHGYSPKDIAILLTVGALVGVIVQALIFDKMVRSLGETRMMKICFPLSALFIVLMLFSGDFIYLLFMIILFSISTSLLRPGLNTLLSKKAGDEQGYVAGMNNSYGSIGNIIGPALAGMLFDFQINLPFLLIGVILLGSLFVTMIGVRKEMTYTGENNVKQNNPL
ncbi:MFS transporter [Halalkalibacter alkaliphilus]|uniref:MFS transporter n=1 Tax=Halalkalibacter alkaliphilus TaxID=2917993 RepID=A0A9X2CWR5_9BACI|nr:MFS transporter [Halalkalibacter alkaliphilus]MCL7749771.1 MFS transporter [Halalkalibacter alkaliphilus]